MTNITDIRAQIRSGRYQTNTSGLMPDLVQGNLVVLPESSAQEFVSYCQANPRPCPIIGISEPGNPALPQLGDDIDIRTDVPEYHIFKDGQLSESCRDIASHWHADSVAIILGCSFSFEQALMSAGLPVRNIEMGRNVSMYNTELATVSTANFACNMVVSMRPYKAAEIESVSKITGQFSKTHGAPIHTGKPGEIGISDLTQPDYGDPVPLQADDVPVFWACGVTAQAAALHARLPLVITHAPGKMLITDLSYEQLP